MDIIHFIHTYAPTCSYTNIHTCTYTHAYLQS